MRRVLTDRVGIVLLAASNACSSASAAPGQAHAGVTPVDAGAEAGDDAGDDAKGPAPLLTPDQRAALQALSPAQLPSPPNDPTNRFADNPAAAALGQRLFFDPSFSGQLLDTDNDGSPETLGVATATTGQTGRVACAGCHIPASGFSDTRSFQRQNLARRRVGSPAGAVAARHRAGDAHHVGWPQGLPLQPDLRPA